MSKARFSVPRGTQDVLPDAWRARHLVLDTFRTALERAGYGRIMTPTFEETGLFARGVGEGTDIVGKEMYTFTDRSDRSLTLRPEGTAPVVRAFINNGMHRDPMPVKLWYFAPMFRYEAPQKGRYREHYQVGVEIFGSPLPVADAELIALLAGVYAQLGIPDVRLHLNSIGDDRCRPAYRELLVAYLDEHADELCGDCRERAHTNPLRAFDCKNEGCRAVMRSAPTIDRHLCSECREHHAQVRTLLDAAGIEAHDDPTLVRGLDYYTRTTFEFKCARLGAQDTIGAGGRYDGLVEQLGGPPTPGVGFGSGIERVVLAMEAGEAPPQDTPVDVYVLADEAQGSALFTLAQQLRARGLVVVEELMGRSRNAALKQASKMRARSVVEAADGRLQWRSMLDRDAPAVDIDPSAFDTLAATIRQTTRKP